MIPAPDLDAAWNPIYVGFFFVVAAIVLILVNHRKDS